MVRGSHFTVTSLKNEEIINISANYSTAAKLAEKGGGWVVVHANSKVQLVKVKPGPV